MYRIDPGRTDLPEEFRRNPFGPHSAELQKVLNVMRWEPIEGKYVLVNTVPHKEWCLAQLPGKRGVPVTLHEDVVFTDLGEAEWYIFRLRWKKHTGVDPDQASSMTLDYRRRILGYPDRVRARPGETIDFKISLEDHDTFEFRTVRIVCGVETPEGAPYREVAVDTPANGLHDASYQRIDAGSYAIIPSAPILDRLSTFSFQAFIMPTLPGDGRQAIISRGSGPGRPGFAVILDSTGALALMVGDGHNLVTVSTGKPLQPWKWVSVAASYDAANGSVTLSQKPPSTPATPAVPRASRDMRRPARSSRPIMTSTWPPGRPGGMRMADRAWSDISPDASTVRASPRGFLKITIWPHWHDPGQDRTTGLSEPGTSRRTSPATPSPTVPATLFTAASSICPRGG